MKGFTICRTNRRYSRSSDVNAFNARMFSLSIASLSSSDGLGGYALSHFYVVFYPKVGRQLTVFPENNFFSGESVMRERV